MNTKTAKALPKGFWRNPIYLLACGFGSGASPFAPGSMGTLVAIPIFLVLQSLNLWLYAVVVLGLFVFGVWICGKSAEGFGVHDHGGIVWDEIVGYLITMAAAPAGWEWVLAGFLLFRLFDIVKPFPIRWLDRKLIGGFGIMFDDVVAGLFAWIILQVLHRSTVSGFLADVF